MEFTLHKAQGSGNDFVLIDMRTQNELLSEAQRKQLVVTICNRNSTLGADGILFVEHSKIADAQMRVFNADGSEPQMCGNGIRIVGRWVAENAKKEAVTVENKTGIIYAIKMANDFYPDVKATCLQIENVNFDPATLPMKTNLHEHIHTVIPFLSTQLKFTAISVPNPHIICFVENIDETELVQIGKKANEPNPIFQEGVNVSMAKKNNNNELFVLTYERGVGITNSCGTAMFSSVVAACKNNFLQLNQMIDVKNKGGFIRICLNDNFGGIMIGNASYVYAGKIAFTDSSMTTFSFEPTHQYQEEVIAYEKLLTQSTTN